MPGRPGPRCLRWRRWIRVSRLGYGRGRMRLVAGIDIGSALTKAVVMQADGDSAPRVIGRGTAKTGVQLERAAHQALELATQQAGVKLVDVYIATTGFGRYAAPF